MKGKPILWQSKKQADIFSPHFCEQLRLEDVDLSPKEQPFYYDLEIQVPLSAASNSDNIENYAFNEASARRLVQPEHVFENILNERANEILNMFRSFGYAIFNVEICAEPMEKTNEVVFIITEGKAKGYDKKRNLKSQITVVSIIPNGPGFRTNLVQTLVDLAIQMKKDHLKKEIEAVFPKTEIQNCIIH